MGDAGSYLLGMVLSALALEVSYTQVNRVAFFAPVLILWVPLCDMALVTFFRAVKGRSVFKASNDHLVLRLVAMGFSRKQTVLLTYLACMLLSAAAFAITTVPAPAAIVIYASIVLVTAVGGCMLGSVKM